MGVHALGHDLERAGREAHRQRRDREGEFGTSVALVLEGTTTTALIGGPADNGGVGAAWVFTRAGTTWSAAGRKAHRQRRGRRRRIRRRAWRSPLEGTTMTALTGGPATTAASARRGPSRARARPGPSRAKSSPAAERSAKANPAAKAPSATAWRSPSKAHDDRADRRPRDNGSVGAAWVFTRSGGTWTQQGAKLTGNEETGAGEFGKSVALSSKAPP